MSRWYNLLAILKEKGTICLVIQADLCLSSGLDMTIKTFKNGLWIELIRRAEGIRLNLRWDWRARRKPRKSLRNKDRNHTSKSGTILLTIGQELDTLLLIDASVMNVSLILKEMASWSKWMHRAMNLQAIPLMMSKWALTRSVIFRSTGIITKTTAPGKKMNGHGRSQTKKRISTSLCWTGSSPQRAESCQQKS